MESIEHAVEYLQEYLEGRNTPHFACRWANHQIITPFGEVVKKSTHEPESYDFDEARITEWVDAARVVIAAARLTGKYPADLEERVRQRKWFADV